LTLNIECIMAPIQEPLWVRGVEVVGFERDLLGEVAEF